MQKLRNSDKSANNPMSSFGLIEENMELSHIYLAVIISNRNSITPEILFENEEEPETGGVFLGLSLVFSQHIYLVG